MEYGLIGKNVTYSYSQDIHELLSQKKYELKSVNEKEFCEFMQKKDFKGINITMPYKQKIIPFLDELSLCAKKTKVINAVVNKGGKLIGYNTDAEGFERLLKKHHIDAKSKKVLILGNGATAKTVKFVLVNLGAKEVYIVSRKKQKNCLTYEEAKQKFDINFIVNTTPYGMYPCYEEVSLLNVLDFPYLEVCVDVIYNPLKTQLIIDAQKKGIKYLSGLEMLIEQAARASEIFLETNYTDDFIRSVYRQVLIKNTNILLIGMPACGKSTAAKNLSKSLNMKKIDLDEEIEKEMGMSINEIFESLGEDKFREIEAKKVKELSFQRGVIISLGGGTLTKEENILPLIRNSIVIFLNRDLELLKKNQRAKKTRPLLKEKNAFDNLYQKRYSLYHTYADIEIKNNGTQLHTLNSILEKLL